MRVIDEGNVVANENLVLDRHTLADKSVTGDLAAPANERVFLNFHEGSDFGLVANDAAVQIDKLGKPDIGA